MATSNLEGKVLGSPCEGCEEDVAVKYCVDCDQDFCRRCITTHENVQSTSNHQLIPVDQKSSLSSSTTTPQSQCIHHQKKLSMICETCVTAFCVDCKFNHKDHVLLSNTDVNLLHMLSARKMPGLFEVLHKLDQIKDGSPEKLNLYNTAREMVQDWKNRLLKVVNEESDCILNIIEKEIKHHEALITQNNGDAIKKCITDTDRHVTELSNARKICDRNKLLHNLQTCDEAMNKARQLVFTLEQMRQKLTIDDVLPTRHQLQKMEEDLHSFLRVEILADTDQAPPTALQLLSGSQADDTARYDKIQRVRKSKQIGKSKNKLLMSETIQQTSDKIVLYNRNEKNVFVYNVTTNMIESYKCDTHDNIHGMATLSVYKHAILASHYVHLLDEKFVVQKTVTKDWARYLTQALCWRSDNTIIVCASQGNEKVHLHEVTLQDATFQWKKLYEGKHANFYLNLMSMGKDKDYVLFSDWSSIAKLHLDTGTLSAIIHLSVKTRSFCVDAFYNILVGDSSGNVHSVKGDKYCGKLANMKRKKEITDIAVRNDTIYALSGGCVYIYK